MARAEVTEGKILTAALRLFRESGFEDTTMRDVAREAGVATGAAYYYYPSKEAIVLGFYARASESMQPKIEGALFAAKSLEDRIRELIAVKLEHFAPDRSVLRALLRNGADPQQPLSPFGKATADIRNVDIAWFEHILVDCGVRIPRDLLPHLPGILWFFQMGIIFFWVIDDSKEQERSHRLLKLSSRIVAGLIKLSAVPLMKPLRKTVLQVVELVKGE